MGEIGGLARPVVAGGGMIGNGPGIGGEAFGASAITGTVSGAGTVAASVGAVSTITGGVVGLTPEQVSGGVVGVASAIPNMEDAIVAEYLNKVQRGEWDQAEAFAIQHRVVLQTQNALSSITKKLLGLGPPAENNFSYYIRLNFACKMGTLTPYGIGQVAQAVVKGFVNSVNEGVEAARKYFSLYKDILQTECAKGAVTNELLASFCFSSWESHFARLSIALELGVLTPEGAATYFVQRLENGAAAPNGFYTTAKGKAELDLLKASERFCFSVTTRLVLSDKGDLIPFALECGVLKDEAEEESAGKVEKVPVLVFAAAKKCIKAFSALLYNVENVESAHPLSKRTALHELARTGQMDLLFSYIRRCVEFLGEQYKQVALAQDSQGKTAADLAYSGGHKRILGKLIEVEGIVTADLFETIIRDGAFKRFKEIVDMFQLKGWKMPISDRIIENAMQKRDFIRELIRLLTRDDLTRKMGDNQETLLHRFARDNDFKSAALILERAKALGVDVMSIKDASDKTPFEVAAAGNNVDVLNLMMVDQTEADLRRALASAPQGCFDSHAALKLLNGELARRQVNKDHVIRRANPLPPRAPSPSSPPRSGGEESVKSQSAQQAERQPQTADGTALGTTSRLQKLEQELNEVRAQKAALEVAFDAKVAERTQALEATVADLRNQLKAGEDARVKSERDIAELKEQMATQQQEREREKADAAVLTRQLKELQSQFAGFKAEMNKATVNENYFKS